MQALGKNPNKKQHKEALLHMSELRRRPPPCPIFSNGRCWIFNFTRNTLDVTCKDIVRNKSFNFHSNYCDVFYSPFCSLKFGWDIPDQKKMSCPELSRTGGVN